MKKPLKNGADALEMAKAILGDGLRIIGATFTGNSSASGVSGRGAVLSNGSGGALSTATSYIDIDFVAETDSLDLAFELRADNVPKEAKASFLRDAISVWVNGSRSAILPRGVSEKGSPTKEVIVSPDKGGGFRVGLLSRVQLTKGQVTSLRIATALGVAGALTVMSSGRAEAAPGGQPGAKPDEGPAALGHENFVAVDDFVEVIEGGSTILNLLANDIPPGQSPVYITSINGVAVSIGDVVVLSTGETITLNDDATITVTADGDPSSFTFEYTATYGRGNAQSTDSAIVTVNTVPCFVAGTMIRTDRGDIPVERLTVGQMVMTRDDGLQPIRWIGQRTLPAEGTMAPVRIARDTFGEHATLMVSPLHRVLIRNVNAELLFGTSEVLVAARDLIDGRNVMQIEGGQVQYVHILFDRHQVVWSEGLQSESFLPGPQTTHCFEQETINEICSIFPDLDPLTGAGYGPAARLALKPYEARLLVA